MIVYRQPSYLFLILLSWDVDRWSHTLNDDALICKWWLVQMIVDADGHTNWLCCWLHEFTISLFSSQRGLLLYKIERFHQQAEVNLRGPWGRVAMSILLSTRINGLLEDTRWYWNLMYSVALHAHASRDACRYTIRSRYRYYPIAIQGIEMTHSKWYSKSILNSSIWKKSNNNITKYHHANHKIPVYSNKMRKFDMWTLSWQALWQS